MTTEHLDGDEITLAGVKYKIEPEILKRLASVFPGKVSLGDHSQALDPYRSYWNQSDWSGGIGAYRHRGAQFLDRVWWAPGVDLSHIGHLVLAPRADAVPSPTGASDFKGFGQLAGQLYGVFGRDVHRYDGASWSGVLHSIRDDMNHITTIDVDGVEHLAIAHEAGVAYSADGTTWRDTGRP